LLTILKDSLCTSRRAVIHMGLGFAVASAVLSGCATAEKNEFAGWSADKLYTEGRDHTGSGDYTRAIALLEATIAQYPFSAQAVQAQFELPYVYWKDENRLKALAAADKFIILNGSHPKLDYMYYLKGIINSKTEMGLFKATLTRQVAGANDIKANNEAFDAFKTLVTQYPSSRYAPDARKRMLTLVDNLARQELIVARYYFEREAYLAAISRSQGILQNFDGSPTTESALIIMVKSYHALNMPDMRDDTLRVLKTNFPQSLVNLDALKVKAVATQKEEVPRPQ
jgi:outer membrane protein assembly factor BamD